MVHTVASASPLLPRRVWSRGGVLASGEGEPTLPGQRVRSRAATRTESSVSATPPREGRGSRPGRGVGGARVEGVRGSAPSEFERRFCGADVRSAGVLCGVRRAARAFVASFLQCGVPIGVTSGAGPRVALPAASSALAATATGPADSPAGHLVSPVFGSGANVPSA